MILLILLFRLCFKSVVSYPQDRIGINAGYVINEARELHFADLTKYGSEWHYIEMAGVFPECTDEVDVSSIEFTDTGFPVEIPIKNAYRKNGSIFTADLFVWSYFITRGGAVYDGPHNNYTLNITGSGTVHLEYDVDGEFDAPGVYSVNYPVSTTDGITLVIQDSTLGDPIRSIQFIIPNHTVEDTFNHNFKELYSDFSVFRTKDLQSIDGSNITDWVDLKPYNYRIQTGLDGINYELMIEMMNFLGGRPHFNIPHLASDDFIEKFAQLIHEKLDPNLDFFVEYSNEVWNSDAEYTQHDYATSQPCGYPYFYANQTVRIWNIFEKEFGEEESHRFKLVIGTFTNDISLSEEILTHIRDTNYANGTKILDRERAYLSLGSFFGWGVPLDLYNEGIIDSISYPEIYERINDTVPWILYMFEEHRTLCDSFGGIRMCSYEGGNGIPPLRGELELPNLEERMAETQRLEGMGDLYKYVYTRILKLMGEKSFANHYTGVKVYNHYSFYGICERMDDLVECRNSTKFRALKQVVDQNSLCYGVLKFDVDIVCSGNGVCTSLDHCSCFNGFRGDRCHELICEENYFGEWCNVTTCDSVFSNYTSKVCGGNGVCGVYEFCTCFEDYFGEFCEVTICNGFYSNVSFVCSDHGDCVRNEKCECDEDFYGDGCEITTCDGVLSNDTANVCDGDGICVGYNDCNMNDADDDIEYDGSLNLCAFISLFSLLLSVS